jgi:hypothetical protein
MSADPLLFCPPREDFMRTADLQKILETLQDTVTESLDHMAHRFAEGAEKLGDDYGHLADFSAGWKKLSRSGRRLFVEQLLKSSGLVIATSVATKAGLNLADKQQKKMRSAVLALADLVQPTLKKAKKKGKKSADKTAKKLKKKLKKK